VSTEEQPSTDDQQPTASEARTSATMEISNAMVRLFKQQFGRGPTAARTHWCGPDVITCILENTLTPAERRLVKMGEHQRLRDTRMFFQYATVREFCQPVEQITGRTVRSFHSSIDTKVEGVAVETFILYPEGQDGPSRAQLDDEQP
jgi:uncharacterized protein YbcI